jgi:hypothetical protein
MTKKVFLSFFVDRIIIKRILSQCVRFYRQRKHENDYQMTKTYKTNTRRYCFFYFLVVSFSLFASDDPWYISYFDKQKNSHPSRWFFLVSIFTAFFSCCLPTTLPIFPSRLHRESTGCVWVFLLLIHTHSFLFNIWSDAHVNIFMDCLWIL